MMKRQQYVFITSLFKEKRLKWVIHDLGPLKMKTGLREVV